ncbi:MAG TPA: DUF362 domain-containing protein [Candidatus Polarisedimenticolaceae bacterium]|nr:DUF362 domain-containing protein [Candidatus Polarisedimenticolaceae bacterium]
MIRVFERGQAFDFPLPEGRRVAVKPNLTFPTYKEGVTTSPAVLEQVVAALARRGNQVTIVESDGGYGAWACEDALRGHGIYELAARHGAAVVNLSRAPATTISVRHGRRELALPYPRFLLEEIDAFVTVPVPKVHCMTGVTLGMKNQWGTVPDALRLNFHYAFNAAILEIHRRLPPSLAIADGTFFLDENGPMEGRPLRRDLIVAASTIGELDRYLCAMMGVDPWRIPHLRHAMHAGFVPRALETLDYDRPQLARLSYRARLRRTPRNWMVLGFFHSKHLTRLIYTSLFGRWLHRAFYAVVGQPTAR